MGGDRVSTSEAMRIAQTEDEHLSIGCDVRHGNGYTVLTSDVCRDMWDANHVRQVDLECDADLSAFIARMETLFRQINREHCKFELDFRTRPQQLAAVLRRRGYVCTRGVVQVYRGATTRIAAERIAAERVAAEGRNASGGIGADRLPSDMVEIEITARSGQSRLADWRRWSTRVTPCTIPELASPIAQLSFPGTAWSALGSRGRTCGCSWQLQMADADRQASAALAPTATRVPLWAHASCFGATESQR